MLGMLGSPDAADAGIWRCWEAGEDVGDGSFFLGRLGIGDVLGSECLCWPASG